MLAAVEKLDYQLLASQVGPREGSALAAFLRGHLWVEARLNAVLEAILVDPSAIDLSRESFARKTALCRAVGGLSPTAAEAILAMNRARNRLAHNLDADVTDADIDAMWEPFVRKQERGQFATRKGEDLPTRMFQWFLNIVWTLYLHEATLRWDREYATRVAVARGAQQLANAARTARGQLALEFSLPDGVPKRPTMEDVAILPPGIADRDRESPSLG